MRVPSLRRPSPGGCSMLVKPAEETPLSAFLLDKLIAEAGVPDGVGKEIVRASAGNLKKVMLELGGKSLVLIYDDADLGKAIPMAPMGIFVHSGQGCVCGSRIFVQRGVYDQVVEGIALVANSIKPSGPRKRAA